MNALQEFRKFSGQILILTGLHIGAGKESMEIGSTDNPIIRHPITFQPYIPGSSLKGKMRSLLEVKYNADKLHQGKPCGCGRTECKVCTIFGSSESRNPTMTRVIFRDAFMNPESMREQEEANERGEGYYSEIKNEISMNRQTMTAQRGGLRSLERVIPGSRFDFEIMLRVFENDPVDEYVQFIEEGLKLIENDYLGGSGSRGYGKVKFQYEISTVKV